MWVSNCLKIAAFLNPWDKLSFKILFLKNGITPQKTNFRMISFSKQVGFSSKECCCFLCECVGTPFV